MTELLQSVVAPTWLSVPDWHYTEGPSVVDFNAAIGYAPDDNQAAVLDAIFAENEQGLPACFEIAVIASRQNIKTALMKMAYFGWLYLFGHRKVVYTAHEWNPACAEMLKDMKELIDGSDMLRSRTRRIYEANGEEAIELMSGARMLFKTRTRDNIRSLAADKIGVDEGFAATAAHMGSLIPTLATRPEAQVLWGSSPGKPQSAILRDLRDRGRAYQLTGVKDPSLAYFEWCAPDPVDACERGERCDHGRRTPGCGCDKPDMWRQANPAMGVRISELFIRNERRTLPPAEFGRERMGWWDKPLEVAGDEPSPLNAERWAAIESTDAPRTFECFAVEVDVDQAWASIGAAGYRPDGSTFLELVERRRGTSWAVARAQELDARHGPGLTWVIDGGGPASGLIADFEEADLEVLTAGLHDVVDACASLVRGVNEPPDDGEPELYAHGPQVELDAAVEGCRKRPLGDGGFTFGRRKSDVDVTPLLAVTLAAWGLDESGGVNVW